MSKPKQKQSIKEMAFLMNVFTTTKFFISQITL